MMTSIGNTETPDQPVERQAAAVGIAVGLYGLSIPKGFGGLDKTAQRELYHRLAIEFAETLRVFGFEIVPVAEGEVN